MSFAPFLELISELLPISRRDFPLASADLAQLNPNGTNPLIDGEWLQLNTSYQLTRGSAGNVSVPSFQLFAERGRYDTQAIGKVPVLMIGGYEAQTSVCDPTGIVANSPLIVGDVTVGGLTKKGLKLLPVASGQYLVVAWATRVVVEGGTTKVRYLKHGSPVYMTV